MVHFTPYFTQPAPHVGAAVQMTSFADNVAIIGLGALAFFSSNLFERTNPGLAAVIRCVVGGVGLVWLFNKCCPSSGSMGMHHHHPIDPGFVTPIPHHKQKQAGFYSVKNMWEAPFSRFYSQNSVQQSHFASPKETFVHQPAKQAQTTYSANSGDFPNVVKVSQVAREGFPDVYHSTQQNYSGLNSAPLTHSSQAHSSYSRQPQLAKTTFSQQPNIMGSGGLSSQPIPTSKYKAPSNSGGFPNVDVYKSVQGNHLGNARQMFIAAKDR